MCLDLPNKARLRQIINQHYTLKNNTKDDDTDKSDKYEKSFLQVILFVITLKRYLFVYDSTSFVQLLTLLDQSY